MVFQKRTCLVVLFLLALVSAIAFQLLHISKTENLYPIYNGPGYGYVNQAGELVVKPQFSQAEEFSEGFAPVKVNDKVIVHSPCTMAETLVLSLRGRGECERLHGKWGFVNLKGQVSISPQYDTVGESSSPYSDGIDDDFSPSSFSEGLAGVKLNGKWGFINQSGKLVIPYQFDKVQRFSGGVATVQVGGLWGVINPEGKWIIQPVDKFPIKFFQGIAKLNLISWNESGQFIGDPNIYWDKSGRRVGDFFNPPKLASEFQEGLAIVEISRWAKQQGRDDPLVVVATSEDSIGSKCGFQDKRGKVVIEPQFDYCQSFASGLAAVQVDKKWGYIDKTGKFIVSPQFDYADRLIEERALVVSDGKIGFIDKTGKIVIKPEFQIDPELAIHYKKEPAAVLKEWKSRLKEFGQPLDLSSIEKWLAQVLKPYSSEVVQRQFSNGLAAVAKDNKCGYIDKTGKFAIQPQFTECKRFDLHGVAQVTRQNGVVGQGGRDEYVYINREGKTFPKYAASLSNFYPTWSKLLTSVMACLLWIVAISCHEFGHAIVAYWGGDRSVKDKGYLSFNPRRYINPLHSIILPAIFLVTGGIPLPGAAVYIEFDQIRNRLWLSATAAAGPIASILFGLLLVPIFQFSLAWNSPHWFSTFIADFISLQFFIALFNLLPIPPLDGYRILSVWLPPKLQDRTGIASMIGLFFLCFVLPFISIAAAPFFIILFVGSYLVMRASGISEEFSLDVWHSFHRWYIALCLLVASLVYLLYKPASIFQLAGLVLENFFPKVALKMYDRALKIDPKSAWSWERKAWTLQRVGTVGDSVEIISACEQAIQLAPYNRFLWRALILELSLSLTWGHKFYEQKLIEAIERYIKLYPKDGWGWGVKALTLDDFGDSEEALLAWEKNIELDPKDHPYKWRTQMKESTLERLRSLGKL
ncbi:WG repeat-containing protein [Brasilonema bromeliae]|uniref:Peptidase M50 n=1 Tax=Brasilonema bromeliae SPC951 TaxID=385972 RepID=A0ABX1PE93_9CYAN|nr:WG repeat-containing protein [Brasilonema bromeliae]NMG22809.1 hypothetical protein [Brasilonema bromeliae SPC951]